jgi:uncharacterized membrane protein
MRGLSPGINDPTTAVDVIHHLKAPLSELLMADSPQRVFRGEEERKVYLPEAYSRTDLVRSALSEIRLFAMEQPAVPQALLEIIADLTHDLRELDHEGRAAPCWRRPRSFSKGSRTARCQNRIE